MPEGGATLIKGHPEVLRLLVSYELLQHILKAKDRLGRQATRRAQLLADSEKRAVHIRRPIHKVDHRSLRHTVAPRFCHLNLTISAAAH